VSGVDLCLCVLAAPSPCWLKGDASFLGNKEEALKVNMSVRAKFYTVSLCKKFYTVSFTRSDFCQDSGTLMRIKRRDGRNLVADSVRGISPEGVLYRGYL
jgi:hypothetical protein